MPANSNQKKVEVAILTSDKQTSEQERLSGIKRDDIMIDKGSILQEDTTILNMYAPNVRVSNYLKPNLLRL